MPRSVSLSPPSPRIRIVCSAWDPQSCNLCRSCCNIDTDSTQLDCIARDNNDLAMDEHYDLVNCRSSEPQSTCRTWWWHAIELGLPAPLHWIRLDLRHAFGYSRTAVLRRPPNCGLAMTTHIRCSAANPWFRSHGLFHPIWPYRRQGCQCRTPKCNCEPLFRPVTVVPIWWKCCLTLPKLKMQIQIIDSRSCTCCLGHSV